MDKYFIVSKAIKENVFKSVLPNPEFNMEFSNTVVKHNRRVDNKFDDVGTVKYKNKSGEVVQEDYFLTVEIPDGDTENYIITAFRIGGKNYLKHLQPLSNS